jgi:hypothetical protein
LYFREYKGTTLAKLLQNTELALLVVQHAVFSTAFEVRGVDLQFFQAWKKKVKFDGL